MLVLSIPDWGTTPFAEGRDRARIAAEIDRFNDACKDEALRLRTNWIDITPISYEVVLEKVLLARDGLHPSGRMYQRWAKCVLPVAEAALRAE